MKKLLLSFLALGIIIVLIAFKSSIVAGSRWPKGNLYIEIVYNDGSGSRKGTTKYGKGVNVWVSKQDPLIFLGETGKFTADENGRVIVKDLPYGEYNIFAFYPHKKEWLQVNKNVYIDKKETYIKIKTINSPCFKIAVFDKDTKSRIDNFSVYGEYEGRYEILNGRLLSRLYPVEGALEDFWRLGKKRGPKDSRDEFYPKRRFNTTINLHSVNDSRDGKLYLPLFTDDGLGGEGALRIRTIKIEAKGYKKEIIFVTIDNVVDLYKKEKYYLERESK